MIRRRDACHRLRLESTQYNKWDNKEITRDKRPTCALGTAVLQDYHIAPSAFPPRTNIVSENAVGEFR